MHLHEWHDRLGERRTQVSVGELFIIELLLEGIGAIMTQQDQINQDVAKINADIDAIKGALADAKSANPTLDLSQLDAAVGRLDGLAAPVVDTTPPSPTVDTAGTPVTDAPTPVTDAPAPAATPPADTAPDGTPVTPGVPDGTADTFPASTPTDSGTPTA